MLESQRAQHHVAVGSRRPACAKATTARAGPERRGKAVLKSFLVFARRFETTSLVHRQSMLWPRRRRDVEAPCCRRCDFIVVEATPPSSRRAPAIFRRYTSPPSSPRSSRRARRLAVVEATPPSSRLRRDASVVISPSSRRTRRDPSSKRPRRRLAVINAIVVVATRFEFYPAPDVRTHSISLVESSSHSR